MEITSALKYFGRSEEIYQGRLPKHVLQNCVPSMQEQRGNCLTISGTNLINYDYFIKEDDQGFCRPFTPSILQWLYH